ncbi:hypothetical protein ACHAXT_004859 [Thalassiosira profunda]
MEALKAANSPARSKAEQPVKDDSPSKPAAAELSATEPLKPAAIDLKVSASSSSETAASGAPALGKAPAAVRALPPKPKRPLSAFNLFYRYKRQKVLEALAAGSAVDAEAIAALVAAPPGSEAVAPEAVTDEVRKAAIRKDLEGNLLPRDTRDRQHRKDAGSLNGAISFLDLGKLMNAAWKGCDDFARAVFGELSEEGREEYRGRLREYHDATEGLPAEKKRGKKGKKRKSKGSADSDDEGDGRTSLANDRARDMSAFADALRTVSMDQHADFNPDAALRQRVQELEGALAAERLRARVRELEASLNRQRSVEDQLRAQLELLSRNGNDGPTWPECARELRMHREMQGMPPPNPPQRQQDRRQDGLWSLVSASMIHNPTRESGVPQGILAAAPSSGEEGQGVPQEGQGEPQEEAAPGIKSIRTEVPKHTGTPLLRENIRAYQLDNQGDRCCIASVEGGTGNACE